ncbi:hypothetical protein BDV97DRAFT_395684 [Delphinella strobiligena]|nr:hypothetical protein BDV97DRAFT_395684 [Delphinella strobiligena]
MYRIALGSSRTAARASPRAHFSTSIVRRNQGPSYQPPTPQPSSPASNPHRDFYKSFGRPTAKVFLMAWATYQIIYWSWSKLDFMEDKEEKEEELKSLERDLQTALKEKETEATAAASASAILPEGLGKSASGRSWWNIF